MPSDPALMLYDKNGVWRRSESHNRDEPNRKFLTETKDEETPKTETQTEMNAFMPELLLLWLRLCALTVPH